MLTSPTLPRGKLLRKAGARFVCPKLKAGALLATFRRAPLYWAAICALKARQLSGYVNRVCGQASSLDVLRLMRLGCTPFDTGVRVRRTSRTAAHKPMIKRHLKRAQINLVPMAHSGHRGAPFLQAWRIPCQCC